MIEKRIKELRISNDMTQKDLADYLGLTPKMVSFYELGQRVPPSDIILKLAEKFGVSTDYLLGNEPPQQEYYHDPEVAAIAQEMHDNPEIKVLFHATKGMKKESIAEIRKFVEFQKMKENGFME